MAVPPIKPGKDDRVEHCYATLNGRRYHYLLAQSKDVSPRATICLIHGWPDLSFGWRYQIPALVALGLRVIAPDMMGYGRTDAPKVSQDALGPYSMKRASDDIAELARQLGIGRLILGGHDWGGYVVYRFALWYPDLISHVFAVCTPYQPPTKNYVSLDMVVERAPQFGYQKHLAGPDVEAKVTSRDQIRSFLNGMYGGRTTAKKTMFSPENGFDLSLLPDIGQSPLLSTEEIDYYADEYVRHGMHGPLNWYRTRHINHLEEQSLKPDTINVPVLFVQANRDNVLLPSLSQGMEKYIPQLSRGEVNAGHWALWQASGEVNKLLEGWFEKVVFGCGSKL